jgi:hypothetical protein
MATTNVAGSDYGHSLPCDTPPAAPASLVNGITEVGFMVAYPLHPGKRYTLLLRFLHRTISLSGWRRCSSLPRVRVRVGRMRLDVRLIRFDQLGASLITSRFSAFFSAVLGN